MRIQHRDLFREPDWRARRCQALIEENSHPCFRRDDRWTWGAWRYFRALSRCRNEEQRERVRWCRPYLAAAVELRESGDPFRRWELEARLLTRESVGDVAERFGLNGAAVTAYAALYFDILGSLDATDYVVLRVIGFTPARTFSEKDTETWLKLFAYMGGPHVLDAMVAYYLTPEPVLDDITSAVPSRLARLKRHLSVHAAILARCIPDADARVIKLHHLNERLEAERGGGSLGSDRGDELYAGQLSPCILGELVNLVRTSKVSRNNFRPGEPAHLKGM